MQQGNAQFFGVESKSQKDKVWIVRIMPDGEYRCDCPAFVFSKGKNCSHIHAVIARDFNKVKKLDAKFL